MSQTRESEFKVVMNHEEQYSIWPQERETPLGWKETGFIGSKDECLTHIDKVWKDIRPLSLRRKLDQRSP